MKQRSAAQAEELLFFRRWIANPGAVGALLPSSPFLAREVARHVKYGPDEAVVEVGAGTGSITKGLLKAGVPAERLFVIEWDADLCTFLRREMPQVQVIHGDAAKLADILPGKWHGRVSTLVSGIPMLTIPFETQQRLIKSWFGMMKAGGQMLQYTYSLVSPIPQTRHGLAGRRAGMTFLNIPPASVFRYEQAA